MPADLREGRTTLPSQSMSRFCPPCCSFGAGRRAALGKPGKLICLVGASRQAPRPPCVSAGSAPRPIGAARTVATPSWHRRSEKIAPPNCYIRVACVRAAAARRAVFLPFDRGGAARSQATGAPFRQPLSRTLEGDSGTIQWPSHPKEAVARRLAGRTSPRFLWHPARVGIICVRRTGQRKLLRPAPWKQARKQQTKLAMKTIRLLERAGYRIEADEEAIARLDAARAERAAARAAARAEASEGAAAEAAE